jgi:hypothetical protein
VPGVQGLAHGSKRCHDRMGFSKKSSIYLSKVPLFYGVRKPLNPYLNNSMLPAIGADDRCNCSSLEGMMMILTEGESGIRWADSPAWQFSQIVLLTGILSQRWL